MFNFFSTSLPNKDKWQKSRQKNLEEARNNYRFNYNLIPPLGIADGVTKSEYPKLKWIFLLIGVGARLIENSIASKAGIKAKFSKFMLPITFRVRMFLKIMFTLLKDPTDFFVSGGTYIIKFLKPGEGINIKEYDELFATIQIPIVDRDFKTDENFTRMRVAGWNPTLIKKIDSIPKKFALNDQLFKEIPGFKNDSLSNALKENRMFLVDYYELEDLENGNQPNGEKFCYAPVVALAIPKDSKELKLIAIQTGQNSKDFPIFTPKSDHWSWQMAKLVVNSADGNYHELIAHLGLTHLVIEPFVVCLHRQLSDRHPIYKLLVPHFNGTIFINYLAKAKLIAPGGGVDYLLSGTIESDVLVSVKNHLSRGFNELAFPNTLQQRKIEDPKILSYYPYRDDGILLWEAIKNWVDSYVKLYYMNDAEIQSDIELQLWSKEIISDEGGRVKDFGEDGKGKVSTINYLVQAITEIIFISSAGHSSVNFPQQGIMTYAPEVPLGLYDKAPVLKKKYSEADWISMMPTLDMASLQLNLGYTLGGVYYTKLGQYGNAFNDKQVAPALKKFQKNLEEIERIIEDRNMHRYPYPYMLPSKLTQSINI